MSRRKVLGILVLPCVLAMLSGCCNTYKRAVETDVANLPATSRVFYEQCVASTCGGLTSELVSAHIRNDATLACLVDSDKGVSTPEKKSSACTCAEGTEIGACKAWLGVQQ